MHGGGLLDIRSLSHLLPDLPLFPRGNTLPRPRFRSNFLPHPARLAHHPGRSDCPLDSDHTLPCVAKAIRHAPPHRRLDTTPVDLCLDHWRRRLLDAIPPEIQLMVVSWKVEALEAAGDAARLRNESITQCQAV